MAKFNVGIDVQELTKDLHVRVVLSGMREFTWRMRIAKWFIWLALIITGFAFDITTNDGEVLSRRYDGEDRGRAESAYLDLISYLNRQSREGRSE